MTTVRIAAIQMTTGVEVDANLRVAAAFIGTAADQDAQLIVLPENFAAMGFGEADRCALAEPDGDGPLQAFLAEQAARNNAWIVGGTIPIRSDDPQRPFASSLVFSADGERVARYDKMHLFDVGLPGQDERLLRPAVSRVVQALPDAGPGFHSVAGGVYRVHRAGALVGSAPGPRD